jgi:hypothetical protein
MNRYVSPDRLEEVVQAFNSDTIVVAIDKILPVRTIGNEVDPGNRTKR